MNVINLRAVACIQLALLQAPTGIFFFFLSSFYVDQVGLQEHVQWSSCLSRAASFVRGEDDGGHCSSAPLGQGASP